MVTLAILASLTLATGLAVWHLCNGRVFTMLAAYLFILAWETCGGLLDAYLRDGADGVETLSSAVEVRLLGLGAFCIGYAVVATLLRIPTAQEASACINLDIYTRLTPHTVRRLLLASLGFAALSLVGLLYKILAAGGISSYLATAYQWRFGTHAPSVADNTIVVISSAMAPTLTAIIAMLAIAWRQSWLTLGGRLGLTLLLLLKISTEAMHGSRMGMAICGGVPVVAAHMQRPFRPRAARLLMAIGVTAALAGNWLHYKAFELTAGWIAPSLEDTSLALIAPHGHLSTLAVVIDAHNSLDGLGASQYVQSAAVVVPRILWQSKPSSEDTGTLAVQGWSGLPTTYQKAPTDVGIAIASLGMPGVALIAVTGVFYALLDRVLYLGIVGRCVVVAICMPRVLADQGMGVSAVSITALSFIVGLATLSIIVPRRQSAGRHLNNALYH